MGDDYTEYSMLDEQDRATAFRNSLVASEGAQQNFSPGAGPNIESLSEGANYDKDRDFECAIGREFVQRVGVKRQLQD